MTFNASTFFIKRFLIAKSGKLVFDQKFHLGVNIIRGANSVGKSTIMDLLFNCIGGDISEDRWTKEAKSCNWLIAELQLNGRVLTICRAIDPGSKPPILFFDGSFDQSQKAQTSDWQKYGLNRTDEKLSFSQQLFDLLGWPHSQTEDFANLTMHQVLRLIFVDQGTPVNKILRAEHSTFDRPSMRQAIGDFMLGLDDLGIYGLKQQLSKAEAEFSKIEGQLDSIYKFITPVEGVLRVEHLNKEITDAQLEMLRLTQERDKLLSQPDDNSDEKIKVEAERLSIEIDKLTKDIDVRLSRRAEILNEIVESELFITAIEARIKSLKESREAYDFFGEVRFKFCPSCLSAISESDKQKCHLCKTDFDKDSREASYLAALNELVFQKKESTKVLEEFKARLAEHNLYINTIQHNLQSLKAKHVTTLKISSERMLMLNNLSSQIGALEERIKNSTDKMRLVSAVEGLVQKKVELNATMLDLADRIKQNRELTHERRVKVEYNLSEKTKALLEKDGNFEPDFTEASLVQFDFGKDMMLVDGRSKFSASSETILKNSFHLAILQESIEDDTMRYPRLYLLDNTEDKGMAPDRSQNFQRMVVESLSSYAKPYQVIMTTSMIDPELDASEHCVGPHYKKGTHTLSL